MAVIPVKDSKPKVEACFSGPSPFDENKLKETINLKHKVGRPSKQEKEERRLRGLSIGLPPSTSEAEKARVEADAKSGEEEAHFVELCKADGVQKVLSALYKNGITLTTSGLLFALKVPKKFFPDHPVPEEDAKAWALALTDVLIESYGAEEALKKLRLVTLIGLPIVHISERVYLARSVYHQAVVQEELKNRGAGIIQEIK